MQVYMKRSFKEDEFYNIMHNYLSMIYDNQNNDIKDVPTVYGLYKYICSEYKKVSYKTIQRELNFYCPDNKKEFEEIRADILARGACMNMLNVVSCIFALKNWCGWKDKAEAVEESDNGILLELKAAMDKKKKTG